MDISDVAKHTGIAASSLRYYEKRGLIRSTGRSGIRRQYEEDVLDRLGLIALGQLAGFTLDEIAPLLVEQEEVGIDRDALVSRANEVEHRIQKLQSLSRLLRHVANCTAPDHLSCPKFRRLMHRALRHRPEGLPKRVRRTE